MPYRATTPNINVNTDSAQLRTEILNSWLRLDGELSNVPQTVYSILGPASNVGTGESILFSTVLDTNSLPVNADSVVFTISGNTNSTANTKQIRLYYGGTLIFDSGSQTFNGISWVMRGEIIRTGSGSQTCFVILETSDTTYRLSVTQTLTNKNLLNNQSLILTGMGGASADVSAYYMKILNNSHF